MILFLKDWSYYPSAIVHTSTKNKSWVDHAQLLRKMGVKNYYSHLALIDPTLEYVDPHSDKLTTDQAQRIMLECSNNIWYYLREVVRVPAKASPKPKSLGANRGNIALYFLAMNDIDVGITQIRQTGKTLNCNILLSYMMFIKCLNTTIYLMTRNTKLRAENVAAIKDIRKLLPDFISQLDKNDADNQDSVTCIKMDNKILTQLPQGNVEDAKSAGRGFTSSIIMIDESAFCKNIQHSYPAMMSSSNAAVDEAKNAGVPTFKLFPCTAGDKGSESGKFMYDIYHSVCQWQEHLLDCENREELQGIVKTNSRNRRLMCYVEFNHRQLGRSDEWLFEKIVESSGSPDDINRDYFNQWSSGSGASPLDRQIREAVSKSKIPPVWVETDDNRYMLQWYISKEEVTRRVANDIKFIAGLDSSEGLGRDQMTLIVVDEQSLETVAALSVSEVVSTIHFSNYICQLMIRYPNMVLIPERRSTGVVIIDSLLIQLPSAGIDPFKRVFNRIIHEDNAPDDVRTFINTPLNRRHNGMYERYKGYFGYATSGSGLYSRKNLYELTLPRVSNYAANLVRDTNLVNELMSLVVDSRGRIDHAASGHDDHVISWLLSAWLLSFGKNLSHYGITNPMIKVMSYKERNRVEEETKTQRHDRQRQDSIRGALGSCIKQLGKAESDMEAIELEKKIRHLSSKLTYTSKLPLSVDELMKEANNQRRNRIMSNKRNLTMF